MSPQRHPNSVLLIRLGTLAVVALIASFFFLTPSQDMTTGPVPQPADESLNTAPNNSAPKAAQRPSEVPSDPALTSMDVESQTAQGASQQGEKEDVAGMDEESTPEDAPPPMPRTTLIIDFPEGRLPPGDARGLGLQGKAMALTTPQTQANPRRVGTFTSEPIALQFPSNAISPLWKAETPEGTKVDIALSLSPNGTDWMEFKTATADVDSANAINPTYPDGRPNPFYGYTPGGVMTFGLSLFSHVRYRVTLYSEANVSPSLTGLRLYYQDTTLGRGHIATLPTPP